MVRQKAQVLARLYENTKRFFIVDTGRYPEIHSLADNHIGRIETEAGILERRQLFQVEVAV